MCEALGVIPSIAEEGRLRTCCGAQFRFVLFGKLLFALVGESASKRLYFISVLSSNSCELIFVFNLVLGNLQVYLVDYGFAYRYCPDGVHKEYKEDPKRCHDGTLEFTSIDAHNGVGTSTVAGAPAQCSIPV